MTIFAKRLLIVPLLIFFIFCLSASTSILSAASVPLAAPIATVNIQDAKIVSQSGNVFSISFKISNREGQQSGVKYGVKLISQTPKGQFLVDEKIYDESVYLGENTTIDRTITYTAPTNLSGEYALVLHSSNVGGFPFGISFVGNVTLASTTKGITIAPESCVLQVENEKNSPQYALLRGIDITPTETLQLRCSASNEANTQVTVTPSFETREGTSYGELVSQTGGSTESITFSANEKKTITVNLPKGPTPKAYNVKVNFQGTDVASNSVTAQYLIVGTSATIQNITLDKGYTKRGEDVVVGLIWNTSVSNIPGSRTPFNVEMGAVYADISVKNKLGLNCVTPFTEILESNPSTPRTDLNMTGKQSCKDPKVSIILKDKNGIVLDQDEAMFETKKGDVNNAKLVVAIVFIVAIAVFIVNRALKKKSLTGMGPNTMLFLFGIIAMGSIIPLGQAHADTFYIGAYSYAYATVNIDSAAYAPGASITVTGSITSTVASSYSVGSSGLTATTTGISIPATVIAPSTIGGGNTIFGNTFLPAPSTPGNYNTTFSAGIDEYAPVTQPTVLVDFGPGAVVNIRSHSEATGWDKEGNPEQHTTWADAWLDNSVCLSQSRTTDTTVRYVHYGSWNNVSLDLNGYNYLDFTIPAGQTCVDGDLLMNTINTCQLGNSNPTGGCFALGEYSNSGAPGPDTFSTMAAGGFDGFGCLIPRSPNVGAAAGTECWNGHYSTSSWHNANKCPADGGWPAYVIPQGMTPNGSGSCVPLSIPPSDICPNLSGNQTVMPVGFVYDLYGQGNCVAGPKVLGSSRLFDESGGYPYGNAVQACGSHVSRGYGIAFPNGHISVGQYIYTDLGATQPLNGQNKWMKIADTVRSPGSYAIKVDPTGLIIDRIICD